MSRKLTTIDAQLLSKKKITAKMLTRQWTIHGCQYLRQQELWCCKLYIVFSHFQWSVLTIVLYTAVLQPINRKNRKKNSISLFFFYIMQSCWFILHFWASGHKYSLTNFFESIDGTFKVFSLFMNFQKLKKKSKNREKKMTVSCHATYRIKSIGRKWKCEHTH